MPSAEESIDHSKLDEEIIEKVEKRSGFLRHRPPGDTIFHPLLRAIVATCSKLDAKYANDDVLDVLFDRHPAIREALKRAWVSGKFEDIRELDVLQARTPSDFRTLPKTMTSSAEERTATINAWNLPFVGSAHVLLNRTIDTMNNSRGDQFYANYLPIVQSSGTGKSRMVDELAGEVFTIPLNLREADTSGYPPADDNIRKLLSDLPAMYGSGPMKVESHKKLQIRFCYFLSNLFDTVHDEIVNSNMMPDQREFARFWRAHLKSPSRPDHSKTVRESLYDRVVQRWIKEDDNESKLSPHLDDATEEDRKKQVDRAVFSCEEKASHSAERLVSLIKERSSFLDNPTRKVELVLYLDESQKMTETTEDGIRSPYHTFCSSLNSIIPLNIFTIFLSTNSNLSRYAPSSRVHPSLRVREKNLVGIQAPFTELPFDLYKGPIVVEDKSTLEDVCTPAFMARFGRPLWWTRWEAEHGVVQHDLFDFAITKLSNARIEADKYEKEAELASLSIRYLLDFEPMRRALSNTEAKLVESHMRIAFSVPSHREYVHTGAPSEPILVEAAARIAHRDMSSRGDTPSRIRQYLEEGIIDKGERGEIVSRLILLEAMDSAVLAQQKKNVPWNRRVFAKPVPLATYLLHLFGPTHSERILDSTPANTPNKTNLRTAFKDAQVYFTHFARASDSSVVTARAAWMGMSRGIAWQCSRTQEGIDICIPVLLGPAKAGEAVKLGENTVIPFLVQVRNRSAKSHSFIDVESLGFFPPSVDKATKATKPYIALTMHLGAAQTYPTAQVSPPKAPKTPPPKKGRPLPQTATTNTPSKIEVPQQGGPIRRSLKNVHPRYEIHAVGCSPSIYAVVKNKDVYAQLLHARPLLSEHSRQTPEHIQALLKQKPFWSEDKEVWEWAISASVNLGGGVEPQEGLIVLQADENDD